MPVGRLGVVVLGSWMVLACSKETPQAAAEPRSPSNAAAAQPAPAAAEASPAVAAGGPSDAAATGVAKVTDPAFELTLDPPKVPLKAGQAGSVDIVLVAKAPFHVNDKYPLKLKLKETPGIKYASLTVGKDAAQVEHMRAVVPVSFTPDAPGKRSVAGQLAFSVCTEDKCLMEKRDLALDVSVE